MPAPVHPSQTTVAWIGTGVMGAAMCGHVLKAGYRVSVHTRTPAKAQPLLGQGAAWAESLRAAADRADIVVTMVGFPRDVRDVYLAPDGILAGARPGSILIDMTTTEPSLSREIAAAASAKGLSAIDAPVSGGDVGAKHATLSIMVGGDRRTVEVVRPLLACLGRKIVYQGPAGAGQHTKLCNQIVIAGTMAGVCESLLYGYRAGLDLHQMLESIRGGAAACWTLDHLAPRMLQRNFDPGFFVEHFVKDMGIALEETARMGLTLPGLTLVHGLYQRVEALGHGRSGTHALLLALEDLSGMTDSST
ncbi:NAD(P)-dependent oxidoreductase [Nitrospira sp. NS4]|uniref:NAD(P)-dependent oxidoreductase n=1 Tax=Nitrospira sp. NS4 TaxID=3414498 RepID=UPI003C2C0B1A